MPEKDGKLSEAEQQLAQKWVKERWKNWACPFSGDTDWDLGPHVVESRPFSGGGIKVGGPVYPHLVLTCRGCGYTVLINAMKVGIFPAKEGNDGTEKSS